MNMNKESEKVKELNKTLGYIEYKDIDDYKQRNQEMIDALKQKSKDELIEEIIFNKYWKHQDNWYNKTYAYTFDDEIELHIPVRFDDTIVVKLSAEFMDFVNTKFNGNLNDALDDIQQYIMDEYFNFDSTSELIKSYESYNDVSLRDYY